MASRMNTDPLPFFRGCLHRAVELEETAAFAENRDFGYVARLLRREAAAQREYAATDYATYLRTMDSQVADAILMPVGDD